MRGLRALPFALLLVLAACGDPTTITIDEDAETPMTGVSQPVNAANGGTVTIPTGQPGAGASIDLDENALPANATVTLDVATRAAPAGTAGPIIDIGPDGTQFQRPVRITVPYDASSLPAGTDESSLVIAKLLGDGTLQALTDIRVNAASDTVSGLTSSLSDFVAALPTAPTLVNLADFTLQLLHAADMEAGGPAVEDAPRFSAVLSELRGEMPEHSITLSSGDVIIPGPFFSASDSEQFATAQNLPNSGQGGRADMLIMNAMGFQASALGNHEFDLGPAVLAGVIAENSVEAQTYPGAAFPYLSANLDFAADADLGPLVADDALAPQANSIAGSVVITVDGEQIGVVGATTPTLGTISSPGGDVVISPMDFDATNSDSLDDLADSIQPAVDALTGAGIDKVILLAHMQQIAIEEALASRLSGVDIIVAGGSNTILADANDRLRAGDTAAGTYPKLFTSGSGEPVAVVNTDGNYRYVGRLVVGFDANGALMLDTIDPVFSGAYATDAQGVADLGDPAPIAEVAAIAQDVSDVLIARESAIFGNTAVYLNGVRGSVRTEETNLGNLTADANLAAAQAVDASATISIKNGGGIRDDIGDVTQPPGTNDPADAVRTPPAAIPAAGKAEGDISQFDIQNALRFNNGLSLVTVTAAELKDILEYAIGFDDVGTVTQGRFPQVGGIQFSVDPAAAGRDVAGAGQGMRIQSLVVLDADGAGAGTAGDVVVKNGELVGDPDRSFRLVTLDFLAGGGDGYPFDSLSAPDRLDITQPGEEVPTGPAVFAPDNSEQDALAEYLLATYPDASNAFGTADVEPAADTRIQYVSARTDSVLDGDSDGDGVSDADDGFPNDPTQSEATDTDGDGEPDVSDTDDDGDGVADVDDAYPLIAGASFQLQLLHAADFEAGGPAIDDAPRFSAVLSALEDDYANTLKLLSGDNYIPGPFYSASNASDFAAALGLPDSGQGGRADILIANAMGFQASAFGNHEFDRGTGEVAGLVAMNSDDGNSYPGAAFPYLSTNLDFAPDANLAGLVVADGAAPQANSIAGSVVITIGGEQIGVVGATTPTLRTISSPGDVGIAPMDFNAANSDDLDALAAEIQPTVTALTDAGINKVILLAHMQQIAIEQALATRLDGVDIIVAGGSNTLLADSNDALRAGDTAVDDYPLQYSSASSEPVLVVNTDGNYRYVGQLVAGFSADGVLSLDTLDDAVNGAYATDDAGVVAVGGPSPNAAVQSIVDAVSDVLIARESNIFGNTSVYLNGVRGSVRTEETNLGNLTADANLAAAQAVDARATISIKNGGGIRDDIGEVTQPPGTNDPADAQRTPPAAIPAAGKQDGDISEFDISNALSFNNGLSLVTVTAAELKDILEYGIGFADVGTVTQGRFPQVGGIQFSFDPAAEGRDTAGAGNGMRLQSLIVLDADGAGPETVSDVVVSEGELVGDPSRTFRMVTLDFLAGGGDGYPFDSLGAADRVDITAGDDAATTGTATFAPDNSEQDALAEYLAANFPDASVAFADADVEAADDLRIQNLAQRDDAVLDGFTARVLINEIDADGPGDETAEFIELFDGGLGNTPLDGLVVVLFNGSDNLSYCAGNSPEPCAIDLDGFATDENGFFVIGGPDTPGGADIVISRTFWLQNGADAVALYAGNGEDFPNDTAATSTGLIDSVVYGTNDSDAAGLLAVFSSDGVQANESSDTASIARSHDGAGGAGNGGAFETRDNPTAGESNSTPPPPVPLVAIPAIQGAGHASTLVGESVRTQGIVTGVDFVGFYLQDPDGDGDSATSDAIFVFEFGTDAEVGQVLEVDGTVSEFYPGGVSTGNLSTTQISLSTKVEIANPFTNTSVTPTTVGLAGGNDRIIPSTTIIDDDTVGRVDEPSETTFDPDADGLDFYESLEAMLIAVTNPMAISGTNRFGEIFIVPDAGTGATGINARGGLSLDILPGGVVSRLDQGDGGVDYNPERMQIQIDGDFFSGDTPSVNVGDQFDGVVTGVLGYDFGEFQMVPTTLPAVISANQMSEVTGIGSTGNQLTVATYNVLNLDPVVENVANVDDMDAGEVDDDAGDGRFAAIANQIVTALATPDIVGLQEVQDNSGAEINDGVVSASDTLGTLVQAIVDAGGPTYTAIEVAPAVAETNGGQPGGNIRQAFLYNAARVTLVAGTAGTGNDSTLPQNDAGVVGLSFNPGLIEPGNTAFAGARKPLAAAFDFNGHRVVVVNNHFSSKGGGTPINGAIQPFVNGSEDERRAQTAIVNQFVDDALAIDANANVVVLGDMNEFTFEEPLQILAGADDSSNVLSDLFDVTGLDQLERYTFIFNGNSQALDHIFVTDALASASPVVDIVHTNIEFANSPMAASDHDPILSSFELAP